MALDAPQKGASLANFTLVVSALLLAQSGAEGSVQRSVSANNAALTRCFESRFVEAGSGRLRFRVGADRRAEGAGVQDLLPNDPGLAGCLLKVLGGLSF